jgi:hypothetical protein
MTYYLLKYLLYFILFINIPLYNGFIVRSSSYGNLNIIQNKNNIVTPNENKLKFLNENHKMSAISLKLFNTIEYYNDVKNILIDIKKINKIYFSHKNNKLLIIYNNNTRNIYYINDNIKVVVGNSVYSSFIYIIKEFINEYIHHIFTSIFH